MGKSRKSRAGVADSSGEIDEVVISLIETTLRERLGYRSLPPEICGFEKERRELLELIKRTVTSGESNSVLVIGPRGSGKTMLIKSVLKELLQSKEIKENLLQVHLNGLLQTNDKIALKEITRQLHLENTVGDKVFGSFAETLQFLLEALKSGSQSSKPILFVLDEFDLFAFHRNQTLLYNLFDISQSAQTPICVLGVTCRLDVIELLEKRVKSRFSHRQLHMFNSLTFMEYQHLFTVILSLQDDFPDQKVAANWNKHIKELSEDKSVVDILQRQYEYSKDVRALKQLLTYPVCHLSEDNSKLKAADFQESQRMITNDSKASMLHGVSILELCLIISMKHLGDIYDGEPFNFEMVYKEYQKFSQRRSSMQVFEKPVVMKAFEHLIALELVKPLDNSGGTKVQKEYRLMSLLIHPSQILTALQKYPNCPTEITHWASCSLAV
ncbi:origin recognition complex subunit 4-like [Ruditapes philippinarum]|uniref:origin recognition complex subunit 4-like n=1 Tax=Ruditapes philippinarum TaxID=129788 RepID=UPI00295B516B|nr:origin recognition complex subunit 4-like [Ruditapes philippinarum]